jgi:hypothetical protein
MTNKVVPVVLIMAAFATIGPPVALADTGVTIDKVTVSPPKMGVVQITATGTMTLAAGDTLDWYQFYFVDPGGNQIPPTFQPPFNPPKSGSSSNYSCVIPAMTQGSWKFVAKMGWTSGGQEKAMSVQKTFTVGP